MKKKIQRILSLMLSIALVMGLMPSGISLNLGKATVKAAAATAITITKRDGTQVVITADANLTGSDGFTGTYTFDPTGNKLTLENFTCQSISANGDFNLHLVGENNINMPNNDGTDELFGISVGLYGNVTITSDTNGKLNINSPSGGFNQPITSYKRKFLGINGNTNLVNGELNINLTTNGMAWLAAFRGGVSFPSSPAPTSSAVVNVNLTDNCTDETKPSSMSVTSPGGNAPFYIYYRDDVTFTANLNAKSPASSMSGIRYMYMENTNSKVTVSMSGAGKKGDGLPDLRKIDLKSGGIVSVDGYINPLYTDTPVIQTKTISTAPANNQYAYYSYTLPGSSRAYTYFMNTDGTPVTHLELVGSDTPADLCWTGGDKISIPAGKVGESISNFYFFGGLRGFYSASSGRYTFTIIEGALPEGLRLINENYPYIYGTPTAPCPAGTVRIKVVDNNNTAANTDDDKELTFDLNYGAITTAKPVTSISVSESSLEIGLNTTKTVTATVTPDDASYPKLSISSSNSNIVYPTVSAPDANGQSTITLKTYSNPGTATITVTSLDTHVTTTITVTVKEATPNATINYTSNKLYRLVQNATYIINGSTEITADVYGYYPIDDSWYGTTISIVKKGATPATNSAAQALTIPAIPAAPAGLTTENASNANAYDGKILGTTSAMLYKLQGTTNWTYCYDGTTLHLGVGTYDVYYRETTTSFASPKTTITITYNALAFEDSNYFDIQAGTGNTTIGFIYCHSYVTGGKPDYTYSKTSGPDWLQVAADGTITGTRPDENLAATTAVIRVTDAEDTYKEITINIGAVTKYVAPGTNINGTAISWNNQSDAVFLLYKDGVTDVIIKAEWADSSYLTSTNVAYKGTNGTISATSGKYNNAFSFTGVATGTYKLVIFKPGKYVPKIITIHVTASGVTEDLSAIKLWLYGDVNYDGVIDAKDATQISRYINLKSSALTNGTAEEKADKLAAAKINTDDVIDAKDITQIIRYANLKTSAFGSMK